MDGDLMRPGGVVLPGRHPGALIRVPPVIILDGCPHDHFPVEDSS